MVAVRARLAAMSCWRMDKFLVAVRARLSSAVLSRLIVGATKGSML